MVPVPESDFKLIDISIISDQSYKFLLQAEIREINKQKARIYKNAEIVYKHKIRFNNSTLLGKRTNNFKNLEKININEFLLDITDYCKNGLIESKEQIDQTIKDLKVELSNDSYFKPYITSSFNKKLSK